jgi:hypothetical protein
VSFRPACNKRSDECRERIDDPVRIAQHPMEPRRPDGLENRVTIDDKPVKPDLDFDRLSSLLPLSPTS